MLVEPSEMLQDFELDLKLEDVEGEPGKGVICAIDEWAKQGAALVLAGGWSSISIPIGQVGPAVQGAQLDWAGTASQLSDKSVFPFYSRLAPSDGIIAQHLPTLLVDVWGYRS